MYHSTIYLYIATNNCFSPHNATLHLLPSSTDHYIRMESTPNFVKRVLREALGDDVSDFKLLVFAVHAFILESGFVRVDHVSDEVLELWKIVNDRLAFPLLIDLCDKAGLILPPCFMSLPMELKLVIFEYLPGDDLAKVCCTCSKLQYLASNDELWKKKFEEEFGQSVNGMRFYKSLYAQYRETKKNSEQSFSFRIPRTRILRYFQRRRGGG
ncbi:putative F-box domain-containing protein [Medicago truncatula]|uniref:Putative F-box domain-containing protein n=2 Tax=Medicago truncatula TaxID=3880 RepID=A0A396H2L0_MEDTR|nr:putative F-box domain-containing protein [Medicago truncatula]